MFPNRGTIIPPGRDQTDSYAAAIARALNDEFGSSPHAIKTVMAWTGASDRAVKYWLAGIRGPGGGHLIKLAKHSDEVMHALLRLTQRDLFEVSIELNAVSAALGRAVAVVNALRPPS